MVVRHRLPRGLKKKIEEEEESDAGGVGFKAQAAHWLTAAHWRDGEGEREGRVEEEWSGVGDGVNGGGEGGGYHRRASG